MCSFWSRTAVHPPPKRPAAGRARCPGRSPSHLGGETRRHRLRCRRRCRLEGSLSRRLSHARGQPQGTETRYGQQRDCGGKRECGEGLQVVGRLVQGPSLGRLGQEGLHSEQEAEGYADDLSTKRHGAPPPGWPWHPLYLLAQIPSQSLALRDGIVGVGRLVARPEPHAIPGRTQEPGRDTASKCRHQSSGSQAANPMDQSSTTRSHSGIRWVKTKYHLDHVTLVVHGAPDALVQHGAIEPHALPQQALRLLPRVPQGFPSWAPKVRYRPTMRKPFFAPPWKIARRPGSPWVEHEQRNSF